MKKIILPIFKTIALPFLIILIYLIVVLIFIKWLWEFKFSEDDKDYLLEVKALRIKDALDFVKS